MSSNFRNLGFLSVKWALKQYLPLYIVVRITQHNLLNIFNALPNMVSSKCPFLWFYFSLFFSSSAASSSSSSLLLFLCGTKDWTQGLVYAKQVLRIEHGALYMPGTYQLDNIPSPFIVHSTKICWILTIYQVLSQVLGIPACITQIPLSC